ncbi:MAG: OsmC family protein [Elusimicrobiota bacterium]
MAKKIKVNFPGGKKVDAEIDGTVIKTDQPRKRGGEGSAPSSFQLFLSSIAACSGYYVLEFCKFREIPMDNISLELECEFSRQEKRYTKININLNLSKDFPKKYEKAIISAINSCPVKKHIIDAPEFAVNTTR